MQTIACYILGVDILVTVTYCMFYRLFVLLPNTAWFEYFVSWRGYCTATFVYSTINLLLFVTMNFSRTTQAVRTYVAVARRTFRE